MYVYMYVCMYVSIVCMYVSKIRVSIIRVSIYYNYGYIISVYLASFRYLAFLKYIVT